MMGDKIVWARIERKANRSEVLCGLAVVRPEGTSREEKKMTQAHKKHFSNYWQLVLTHDKTAETLWRRSYKHKQILCLFHNLSDIKMILVFL